MAIDVNSDAAQAYENNTDGSEWLSEFNDADVDGDDWTDGLEERGVDNADQLDGDSIWANNLSASQDDADEYNSNTTAAAWANNWGDASNWDV